MLSRGVAGILVVPFLCGCVSYQEHQSLQDDLSRSKRNTEDLIARYQRDMGKYQMDLLHRKKKEKVPSTRDIELQEKLADLKKQLLLMTAKTEALDNTDGKSFEQEDLPSGGKIESGGLSLGSNLLFHPGQARLRKDQLPSLDQVGKLLKGKYSTYEILIEGHTDNQPLKSTRKLFEYNLVLGYERASNVFKYLSKRHGLPESRFQVMSYGMARPLNPKLANTQQGQRENRRVVFRLKRNIH